MPCVIVVDGCVVDNDDDTPEFSTETVVSNVAYSVDDSIAICLDVNDCFVVDDFDDDIDDGIISCITCELTLKLVTGWSIVTTQGAGSGGKLCDKDKRS